MDLLYELKNFHEGDVAELTNQFECLAKSFLYGGYIRIRNDFRVYIRTVEFYFHSERLNGVHDPIVYHRNGIDLEVVPYFPVMSFHAHASGIDITFENSDDEYRASVLIRAYEIYNIRNGVFLLWDKSKSLFVDINTIETQPPIRYNVQSTYLYAVLNGFEQDSIAWVNEERLKLVDFKIDSRKNVFQSQSEWSYKPFKLDENGKPVKCGRPWSFTRQEEISLW